MQVDFAVQLRPHGFVFVVGRRLEGAVGENEMAFLAERLEPGEQLRIVELVERRINLAVVLLDVVEQRQQLRAQ